QPLPLLELAAVQPAQPRQPPPPSRPTPRRTRLRGERAAPADGLLARSRAGGRSAPLVPRHGSAPAAAGGDRPRLALAPPARERTNRHALRMYKAPRPRGAGAQGLQPGWTSMKRATLVHNPTAGQGRHSSAELKALLKQAGFRVAYVHAKKKQQMKKLRRARGLIVAAGGDGTVHRVARAVAGRGKTVAIIPLGTANNIARSLGVHGTPGELVAGLSRAKERVIDVGIAKGPWGKRVFMEGMGGGLFAE